MATDAEFQRIVIKLETRVEALERQVIENQKIAISGLTKVESKLEKIEQMLGVLHLEDEGRKGMLKGAWMMLGAVAAIGAALGISIKQLLSGALGQ